MQPHNIGAIENITSHDVIIILMRGQMLNPYRLLHETPCDVRAQQSNRRER